MESLHFPDSSARKSFSAEYPFASRFFDRDGVRMHYVDEGEGKPLVMVHGNPSWSYLYRNLVRRFSDRFRCIAPDHIGCGLSDAPGESRYEYTLDSRVDDLDRLLAHLGVEGGITLVLHDWGGMIGMAYADRHPERIERIVLFNTGAFPLPASKPFPWPLWLTRTWLGEFLVLRFNAFSRVAARVCCRRRKMRREIRAGYVAPYENPARRLATLRFVQDIPLRESDRAYATVGGVASRLHRFRETPALICWGGKDFVFDRHFLREWQNRWPQAKVHLFPDCGHYVLEDNPEEIASLMETFLGVGPGTRTQ